jgi:hypothetical protein
MDDNYDWSAWKKRQSTPKKRGTIERTPNIQKNRYRTQCEPDSTPGFVTGSSSDASRITSLRRRRFR